HVPANQDGEIQLLSTLHTFQFHAGPNGNVSVPIRVPVNIGAGEHTLQLCWNGSCHASATLHVIEPVALVTPSPGSTPSTAPGAAPPPGSPPGGSPQPSPISSPRPTASSQPPPPPPSSPTPNPCPTSSQSALLAVSPGTIVA